MYCDFHMIHFIILCPVYFIWSWFKWYFYKRRPNTHELTVPKWLSKYVLFTKRTHSEDMSFFISRLHYKLRKKSFIDDLSQVYKHRPGMCLTCAFYVQCFGKLGFCVQSSYNGFPWYFGYPSPVTSWQFHTQYTSNNQEQYTRGSLHFWR